MWSEYNLAVEKESLLDSVYKLIWSNCTIDRHQKDKERNKINNVDELKDKEGGIDVTVRLRDGTPLTFQEKTRRANGDKPENRYLRNRLKEGNPCYDFPLERWNNPPLPVPCVGFKPKPPEEGEYFKAFPQFHIIFYDYDEEELARWYIINTGYFRDWFATNNKVTDYPSKHVIRGLCSFHAIPVEDLIKYCPISVFYDSWRKKDGIPIKHPYI